MKVELKEWLNSINEKTPPVSDELIREYPAYIINRCLSGHVDTLMYANEMNLYPDLDKKLQYDFYINIVRKRRRFSPWEKKEKIKDLEYVKSYYGYSNDKAEQALRILSEEQLDFIKSKLDRGGKK